MDTWASSSERRARSPPPPGARRASPRVARANQHTLDLSLALLHRSPPPRVAAATPLHRASAPSVRAESSVVAQATPLHAAVHRHARVSLSVPPADSRRRHDDDTTIARDDCARQLRARRRARSQAGHDADAEGAPREVLQEARRAGEAQGGAPSPRHVIPRITPRRCIVVRSEVRLSRRHLF